MTQAQQIAEQATGCHARARNGGPLFIEDINGIGVAISDTKAHDLFRKGKTIHAPNAGAGSYTTILKRLGLKWVKVEDWTSSAGDWCFRVWNKRLVFQSNRFPHYGFSYSLQDIH
jgi:hypothetical protein